MHLKRLYILPFAILVFITANATFVFFKTLRHKARPSTYTINSTPFKVKQQRVQHNIYIIGEGRLGNALFQYTSGVGIALQLNTTPCISTQHNADLLAYFDNIYKPFLTCPPPPKPLAQIQETRFALYDLPKVDLSLPSSIQLKGYFQSYKYFNSQYLPQIKAEYLQKAMEQLRAYRRTYDFIVSIHIRRGDMVNIKYITPPPKSYFVNAMQYYNSKHNNTAFIIIGEDTKWIVSQLEFQRPNVYTILNALPINDLSLMVMSDGVVISVGTFGWWGAFLNTHGKIIYNPKEFDFSHAKVANSVRLSDYYLPSWHAQSHISQTKVAIIIPYRNRLSHLKKFEKHIMMFMKSANPHVLWHIWAIEQLNSLPFKRAWLANVGIKEILKNSPGVQCIVLHDVDRFPASTVDYSNCDTPIQLSSENNQWKNNVPYNNYAGGVVALSPAHWEQINGMSNDYQGWGAEDDDLHHRLRMNGLLGPEGHILRPGKGKGLFTHIEDNNHGARKKHGYSHSLKLLRQMEQNSDRWKTDGLNSVKYTLLNITTLSSNMTHISVF